MMILKESCKSDDKKRTCPMGMTFELLAFFNSDMWKSCSETLSRGVAPPMLRCKRTRYYNHHRAVSQFRHKIKFKSGILLF